MTTHLVVDMLYDFIDGSMACNNVFDAVKESIKYINAHPEQKVIYICDNHPRNHCSFKENGGVWPAHCVQNTRGGEIHEDYYTKIEKRENRPSPDNTFFKGRNVELEEYSGFAAVDNCGVVLNSIIAKDVVLSGIATEYCIKETALNLYKHGFKITILENALAYVDPKGHLETMAELVKIITVK